jgi:signal peptide peptidase SppA
VAGSSVRTGRDAGSIPTPAASIAEIDPGRVQKCAAQHFGPWMIETAWFERAVAAVKAGIFVVPQPRASDDDGAEGRPIAYRLTEDGIAVLSIEGQMQKGDSSFGGTSSVRVRQALRQAVRGPETRGIMILGDSPGGTVAGTAELAADVAAAAKVMPVHIHIEDLGASAMYWIASQGSRVTATATSLVGSIGTVAVVEDSSGEMAREGVVVHVVSTGPYKGAFFPGAPVSEKHLAYLRSYVDGLNEHFIAGVAAGRRVPVDRVRTWADGRIHLAEAARQMGMIDAVESQDAAFAALRQELANPEKGSSAMWNPIRALAGAFKAEPVVEATVPVVAAAAAAPAPAPSPAAAAPPVAGAPPEQPERVDAKGRHGVPDPPPAEPAAASAAAAAPGATVSAPAPEALDKGHAAEAAPQPGVIAPVALEGPVAGRREVVVELSVSDRATVEADLLANLKRFTDTFGPEGAAWFAAGKTFAEAQALALAALRAENQGLATEVKRYQGLAGANRGEASPVSFQPEGAGTAKEQDLAAKIGPNLAKVAGALKFAKK